MDKAASELELPEPIRSFPGDPTLDVCPTEAITWDEQKQLVAVDSGLCIGCGLCVARCPYGALSLTGTGKAIVHTDDPRRLVQNEPTLRDDYPHPHKYGSIGHIVGPALAALPESMPKLGDTRAALLIRNAFNELGVPCKSRRRGDTNMRIDAVAAFPDAKIAVIEVELSNASVESPRALLEDVAIMHSRYGVPLLSIYPISLVPVLPAGRSDYYRVIDDIETILGLRCRTITVAALLILMWHFRKLKTLSTTLFRTTSGSVDLSADVKQLAPDLSVDVEPHAGAFRLPR
jgi:ferredoxin